MEDKIQFADIFKPKIKMYRCQLNLPLAQALMSCFFAIIPKRHVLDILIHKTMDMLAQPTRVM